MKTKIIPDEILDLIPTRYRFLDEITFDEINNPQKPQRLAKNTYYKSDKILCFSNYRKTSKLLIEDENQG